MIVFGIVFYPHKLQPNFQVLVGPQSVGYKLTREGLVFGGSTVTTSDVAVAQGLASMGHPEYLTKEKLPKELSKDAMDKIHSMLEDAIDRVKVKTYSTHAVYFVLAFKSSNHRTK